MFTDRRSGPARPTVVRVSAAKERYLGSGSVAPEVASLEFPSGGYRVQRVQTEEMKAVLPALDARSFTVSA